jgi:HAD superfamily hydrolase (TIGR01549 family)
MYLFLDLDNTLIPSKKAYDFAIQALSEDWVTLGLGTVQDFQTRYQKAREAIKLQLAEHSSNRLRILCFKNMVEGLRGGITGKEIEIILALEQKYYEHFASLLKLEKSRDNHVAWENLFIKLKTIFDTHNACILTNENLRTQLLKISYFFPTDLKWNLITSEEVGVEKPHPKYFEYAFKKTGKKPSECLMIGDNLKDDILGAGKSGISAIHMKSIFGESNKIVELSSDSGIFQFESSNIFSAIDFALNWKNSAI